ncbi:MAG: Grx4 family monothiol glutaredoxin [Alphaproteobacteria bacterium]|nr:Grx4 family monothiol glutaredoxin [Alphaproteobacteria bacterium]MDD9919456.1 Grx4 family monothiol glutaredoxin [Alphaproteobacteria bacterium]
MTDIQQKIDDLVNSNKITLFMKGSKDFPMCGFSARVATILNQLDIDYLDINVLEDGDIREGVKEYANWPTIPQLYINGEFIGGCDIVVEMFQAGELQEQIEKAA